MQYIAWNIERLEEVVALWNQELGKDFPMRDELLIQNSFYDINVFNAGSLIVVNDHNHVIGFVVTKKWQDDIDVGIGKDMGWIQVLLVDSSYRNQGIGATLLHHAESKLKEHGITRIILGKDAWHYFPGIPTQYEYTKKWFTKHGYKLNGKEFDLDNHYHKENMSIPIKEGVEVSLLNIEEKGQFLNFMHRCFPGRWEYEAKQYFQKGGTGREFVVLKREKQIIGFCRINDSKSPVIAQNVYWAPLYEGELGGIGPLGIDSNERKHGYGLFIVEAAIAYLRNRNIHSILIDWTGLVTFYNKLGFKICNSYDTYEKDV
ncbi:GNAT family N-acetyltransferase [Oceanobacillus bengalensis]|uniref:GNAT family N-acetyltransferase n=1 Tax=Oceanobacillus bengalensis TaxID=1435466 RepID=A0A494YZL8_9BACI|nr:GNAT family N-acetyltransferase [Oceanobacillus bengalensis]RKQ15698.1 GNAT family N-acetyltransferase [Oceanobacillus bengalensis]